MFGKQNLIASAASLTAIGIVLGVGTQSRAWATPQPPEQNTSESQAGTEQAAASQIVTFALPGGAQKITNDATTEKFHTVLRQAAQNNQGTISRSEAILWTGDSAKNAINDMGERLKAAGYTYAPVTPFDSEAGRVTAIAAMRGSKSDSVIGLWIETKENQSLLIWGRFVPNSEKAAAPKKAVAKAAPKKAAVAPKKAVAAMRNTAPARTRTYSESAASRQAKAFKAYQDYQYVKYMGPISGSMYRSTKW